MYLVILLSYCIFSYLSFKYSKKDLLPDNPDYIVALSASTISITNHRINHAKELATTYVDSKILACGKYKKERFNIQLADVKEKVLLQDRSTNTYEDALETRNIIKDSDKIILVTSHSHQIRALNTFIKFFKRENIYCSPTNDLLTWYSPLLPTGWIASLMNYLKDKKYNS